MRFYGYLRASTKEQNAERAKDALSTFATSLNVDITAFFVEYESGTKLDRPELVRLLEICAPGDAIVVAARLIILSDPILSALPDPQSLTLSYGDGSH